MTLRRETSVPLYVQVADVLRDKIYSHEWEAGCKIPTEYELCGLLGVSRGCVKRGMSSLVSEGLLVQCRGRGTFVTDRKAISHPTGNTLLSFAESLRSQGIKFETRQLGAEIVPADAHLARMLYISESDPVFFLRRVRLVEGKPIMYIENRIRAELVPDIEEVDFSKATLFETMERLAGRRIGFSNARYDAEVAGESRGRALGVSPESPVLHLEQHIFYADDTPAEWGNVWLQAYRYVVGTILPRA
ncbi:GntR family transcriptional regulator [Parafannyhessea umbonata]|uniref:Transcriptional regulator, GntR family n=1 Tax=Parafannyhessea umbonata TaxID=604330 RepID=A0A1H9QVM6_9ACTN|nr:GntR family transcriptional regulator [Parafannyhessea umbonata]SER64295.1 transcriptional regulator, GntR family [Parafannyhessea umbonata]